MTSAYEFFDHPADIGVRVYGATLSELLIHAAQALAAAMGKLATRGVKCQRHIELRAETPEDLLHDWLAEILFEITTRHVLYHHVEIVSCGPGFLSATVRGGGIDFARSQVTGEIKAVTYHQLRVEQLPDTTWHATVIFDV